MKGTWKSWLCAALGVCMLTPALTAGVFADGTVAQIGDASYSSLQAAFDAVPADGTQTTIHLVANVVVTQDDIATLAAGRNAVLDMDGHSITVAEETSMTPAFQGRPIINQGTLTVTGDGTIDTSASKYGGYGAISNEGTLVVENGTFAGSVMGNGSAIRNTAGETTIEDGDFTGTAAVYNAPDATLTINGGNFHTTSCNQLRDDAGQGGYWAYCINSHGNLTFNDGTVTGVQGALGIGGGHGVINGGTFTTVACEHSATGAASFYGIYVAGESDAATAEINGGVFTSASREAGWFGNSVQGDGGIGAEASVQINGGIFNSGDPSGYVIRVDKAVANPNILGGTYNKKAGLTAEEDTAGENVVRVANDAAATQQPLDAFFPEDYKVIEGEDGSLTVYPEQADYSKVDAALAKVPEDLSIFTEETAKAVNDAVAAVVRGKGGEEQDIVDGYAQAIEAAIAALAYRPADYTKVDAALAKVPEDLSIFTEETAKAVNDAVAAVVRGKDIREQDVVDGYARAIEEAIAALQEKPAQPETPETPPETGVQMFAGFGLALVAAAGLAGAAALRRRSLTK